MRIKKKKLLIQNVFWWRLLLPKILMSLQINIENSFGSLPVFPVAPDSTPSPSSVPAVEWNVNIGTVYFQKSPGTTTRKGSSFNTSLSHCVPHYHDNTINVFLCCSHHTIHGQLWRLWDFWENRRWRKNLCNVFLFRSNIIYEVYCACFTIRWQRETWGLQENRY